MTRICVATYCTSGKTKDFGVVWHRREFARGEHRWFITVQIAQKSPDGEGEDVIDEHEIPITEPTSLTAARVMACKSVDEILPEDGPIITARIVFYAVRQQQKQHRRKAA